MVAVTKGSNDDIMMTPTQGDRYMITCYDPITPGWWWYNDKTFPMWPGL